MPIPCHLRVCVIAENECVSSICAAAREFSIAISTAVLWRHAYLDENGIVAKSKGGGRNSHRSEKHAERILGRVEAQADMTLAEILERLAEQSCSLSVSTVWSLLHREGHSRRNEIGYACEEERDDVQVMRRELRRNRISLRQVGRQECGQY